MVSVYIKALYCFSSKQTHSKYWKLVWTQWYRCAQTHCSKSLICSVGAENEPSSDFIITLFIFISLCNKCSLFHINVLVRRVIITLSFAQTLSFSSHADLPHFLSLFTAEYFLCWVGVSYPTFVCSGGKFPIKLADAGTGGGAVQCSKVGDASSNRQKTET